VIIGGEHNQDPGVFVHGDELEVSRLFYPPALGIRRIAHLDAPFHDGGLPTIVGQCREWTHSEQTRVVIVAAVGRDVGAHHDEWTPAYPDGGNPVLPAAVTRVPR